MPLTSAAALPAAWQRAIVLGALALHALAGWALLQVEPVRRALSEGAPMAVEWIAAATPPTTPPPPQQPEPPRLQPRPVLAVAPPPLAEAPAFVAPVPPPEPPLPPAPVVVAAPAPLPAPAAVAAAPPPAAPPAPRTVAIGAVDYLSPPQLNYPLASRRMQEQGLVQVRVLVDAQGLPQQTSVIRSSGHPRLDEAALATVRATRFKPYTENGLPLPFWVVMPLVFELES